MVRNKNERRTQSMSMELTDKILPEDEKTVFEGWDGIGSVSWKKNYWIKS